MSITDDGVTTAEPDTIDLTASGSAAEPDAGSDPGQESPQVGARPQFSITDAAIACAVSRKTITRKLADLAEHGAAKDEDGVWRIPVEALLAVGLHPGRSVAERPAPAASAPSPAPASPRPAPQPGADLITVPRDRWDDLRIRLARAEAQAAERELALADARLALRALTAGPSAAPAPAADPVVPPEAVTEAVTSPAAPGPVPQPAPTAPIAPAATALPAAVVDPPAGPAALEPDAAAEVALARNEAARTGGYVPAAAAAAPVKKRRWWHGKGA